jgi:hypothetical protein
MFQKLDLFLCTDGKEGCHKVKYVRKKLQSLGGMPQSQICQEKIAITGPDIGASPIFHLVTKTYAVIILLYARVVGLVQVFAGVLVSFWCCM